MGALFKSKYLINHILTANSKGKIMILPVTIWPSGQIIASLPMPKCHWGLPAKTRPVPSSNSPRQQVAWRDRMLLNIQTTYLKKTAINFTMFRSKFPGGHLASRLSPFVTQMPPREILCDICLLLNLFRIYVETCTLPQCFSHLRNGYLHFVSEYYHAKSHTLTQMQGSIETVYHCRQSSLSMRSVKYSTIPLVVVPTCHCPFP